MSRFDAATAVERLEYDFTEYGGGAGVIPEPTTKAINQFFAEAKAIMSDTKGFRDLLSRKDAEDITDEEAAALLEEVGDAADFTRQMQDRMIDAVAALCGAEWEEVGGERILVGGSPTREDLARLPFRVAQAFNQWLMGELRPKAATPGTKR